jgi:hypothetical protein
MKNLLMHFTLVVVPDSAARLREHGLDREKKPHLLSLEDAELRIDERNVLTVENEAGPQLI